MRPSLTPAGDMFERGIEKMVADLGAQKGDERFNQAGIRMSLAMLPGIYRGIGAEMDAKTRGVELMTGLSQTLANAIATAIRTLGEDGKEHEALWWFIGRLVDDVNARMGQLPDSSIFIGDIAPTQEGRA